MNASMIIPPHGGQLHKIAARFGIPEAELLDFSANINPDGPPGAVREALQKALNDQRVFTDYPDLDEELLRKAIACYAHVPFESVMVANGFVPLLETVLRTFPVTRCLLPVPSFGEYRPALERAGIEAKSFVLDAALDFRYDLEELLAKATAGQCDAILLANPQNPSGVLCEREVMIALAEEASKRNIRLLLDEAFIDYAPAHSLVEECSHLPNLIVFRSVTKFHGVPGLRAAYAVAHEDGSSAIRRNLAPWSITSLSSIGVRAALEDEDYVLRTLHNNERRRLSLIHQLRQGGVYVYPSSANFLLLRFDSAAEADHCWEQLITERKIVLRTCSNFEGLTRNHLRCAVRTESDNSYMAGSLLGLCGTATRS